MWHSSGPARISAPRATHGLAIQCRKRERTALEDPLQLGVRDPGYPKSGFQGHSLELNRLGGAVWYHATAYYTLEIPTRFTGGRLLTRQWGILELAQIRSVYTHAAAVQRAPSAVVNDAPLLVPRSGISKKKFSF